MAVRDGKMLGTVKADSDIYAEYIARMVCGLKKEGTVPKEILEGHDREVWIPWEIKICQNWENRECKSAQIYRIKII